MACCLRIQCITLCIMQLDTLLSLTWVSGHVVVAAIMLQAGNLLEMVTTL